MALTLYNTLTRRKEPFAPLNPPYVGMYVCGPTVYGDPHLGHARAAITFDVLYRYLTFLGYKVRYVRNITDVGHLEGDADEGEDKVLKRARLEKVEPIEIAQRYTALYHKAMDALNVLRPSIEPTATGHIPQQIAMIKQILERGYAYEVNGSVYLDVERYRQDFPYGILSGRNVEELLAGSRELEGQAEKRHPWDFALWKRAEPTHLMQWDSPWGRGYPGWHIECSAMSTHYLGVPFDIHGGGLDLVFPHHEAEIAQAHACYGEAAQYQARFWIHNNLVTIEGQKMSKSLGNFITIEEVFSGRHPKLSRGYPPMALRFLVLQAHYRSTLDFSEEALGAAYRAYLRLMNAYRRLGKVRPHMYSTFPVEAWREKVFAHLNDDLNTAAALALFFEQVDDILKLYRGEAFLTVEDLEKLRQTWREVLFDIMGLLPPQQVEWERWERLVNTLVQLRRQARSEKNFPLADFLRDELQRAGVKLLDFPDETLWEMQE
ncbi:MAG: cysteine--tRNA ligase [Bacteroidia bacterium]|nr:cysteine--tRNA ligase [Bacteroidia bacterium]MCX7764841.1 cysteine--tRNA ligase [Bacteroidia bacterium]MDW8057921.1 cysteine--tRNA ligase [Bacteroidia bacterium]